MNVVTCYKAAQVAGVSKQAIQSLKKANTLQKGKYPFFCYDPGTGDFGVDLENKHWLNYLDRNKDNPKKKKRLIKKTISKDKTVENSKDVNEINLNKFLDAVVDSMFEIVDFTEKELEDLKKTIDKKYDDPNWKMKKIVFKDEEG